MNGRIVSRRQRRLERERARRILFLPFVQPLVRATFRGVSGLVYVRPLRTGRLSASEPNLQNIPTGTTRSRELLEAFKPAEEIDGA